jgi:hypothetical protein
MGGGKQKTPKFSPEERAYQKAQADLLNQQRQMIESQRQQNMILAPFFARQEGFDVDIDPATGQIRNIYEIASPERARQQEIRRMFEERSLAALKGELPVDPAMERSLKEQETELRNRLAQQFGPGYETTTPGIQTLGEFFKTAEGLRYGARTGQLTLAEQLGLTREQQEMFRRGTAQDVMRQFSIADPMSFAGAFGQVGQGYQAAQAPFATQRQLQAQIAAQNRQQQAGLIGAGLGAAGTIIGGAMGGPMGAAIGSKLTGIAASELT